MTFRFTALCLIALTACAPEPVETPRILTQTAEDNAFTVLSRRGYSENVLMRFRDAESSYRETALIAGELFPDDRAGIAEQQVHLALNKSNLGEYELAESIFAVSKPVLDDLGGPLQLMKYAVFFSQHQMNKFEPARAEQEADRALALAEQLRGEAVSTVQSGPTRSVSAFRITDTDSARISGERPSELGLELDTEDLSALDKLSILEANALYVKAASLVGQSKPGSRELVEAAGVKLSETPENTAYWLRGEVFATRSSAAEAAGELTAALSLVEDAIRVTRSYAPRERPEALAHLQHGRLLLKLRRTAQARRAFGRGIDILARGGRGIAYDEIAGYLTLLANEGSSPDTNRLAFKALQQLRSPVTSDTLAQLAARLATGTSSKSRAVRVFQDNERAVNRLTARIDQLTAAPGRDVHALGVARDRLIEAQNALAASRSELASVVPNYNQIVDGSIALSTLQSLISPDETFVLIRLGADTGAVAAISRQSFTMRILPQGRTRIGALVARVRASVNTLDFDVAAAREIYETVIGPITGDLGSGDNITIAPDGPLLSMPANLMIDAEPTNWAPGTYDFTSISWWGTQKAISIAMSPQSFVSLRQATPSRATLPFRGFGGFVPFGTSRAAQVNATRAISQDCLPITRALGQLAPLDGTSGEIQKLREIFGTPPRSAFLGSEFTDARVTGEPMNDARILHFASHALLPLSEACLSQPTIVTSLGGAGSDALLDASEIVDLDLDADLVVLSACDTGGVGSATPVNTGLRGTRGEGLSGLVRAFFFSGARNVVASHWLVPDEETVKLMVGFYENANAGRNFAEAMRDARKTLASDPFTSHPRNWSAFSVIGDGQRTITQ